MSLKGKFKEMMGQTLIRTGFWNRLLRAWAQRHESIILTYHRVIEKWDRTLDYSQPGLVVTAETFDRQLHFLKQHFNIVPLSSIVNPQSEIRNPKCPDRPFCSITFDDGWRDNYEIAFPIFKKHTIPATIFLTTNFIGTERAFWHTELMHLLLNGELHKLRRNKTLFQAHPPPVRHRLMRLARMDRAANAYDVDPFIECVKKWCTEDAIEQTIQDFADVLGLRRPFFPDRKFFLDWDQVRELAEAGIEIGSHGYSHRILTRLKAEDAEEELIRSKAAIEGHIGQEVQHFAFPDGAWNRGLLASVSKAGYRTACLCVSGPDEEKFRSLALPRLGMAEAVSATGDGSFSETLLTLWLLRASRTKVSAQSAFTLEQWSSGTIE